VGLGCGQNEGSFGCEAVAFALGQPNVPECGRIFLFCLSAANFHYRCLFFQLAPNGSRLCVRAGFLALHLIRRTTVQI